MAPTYSFSLHIPELKYRLLLPGHAQKRMALAKVWYGRHRGYLLRLRNQITTRAGPYNTFNFQMDINQALRMDETSSPGVMTIAIQATGFIVFFFVFFFVFFARDLFWFDFYQSVQVEIFLFVCLFVCLFVIFFAFFF